jgi:hypothetical protein
VEKSSNIYAWAAMTKIMRFVPIADMTKQRRSYPLFHRQAAAKMQGSRLPVPRRVALPEHEPSLRSAAPNENEKFFRQIEPFDSIVPYDSLPQAAVKIMGAHHGCL